MENLPSEVWWNIFQFLDFIDLTKVSLVCSQWRDLSSDDQFWKLLCAQRNWKNKTTTWRHCLQYNLKYLFFLNKRLAPGLDDFIKLIGHFYSHRDSEISVTPLESYDFFKQYFKNNNTLNFIDSTSDCSWMNYCGFRTIQTTMLECCIVEKTVGIPILDVVDLILDLNHRILWDQAMYGGNPLQKFLKHELFTTDSPTSIPAGFETIPQIKLLSLDAADMFWSVGTREDLELLHLRCFRGVYKVSNDALLLLEEGISKEEDSVFTEPFPTTTTYQEDEVLKLEPSNLPHYQNADRFVVKSTGFFLQRIDESTTKMIYLIQLVTDEFDMMVLEVRQRLRTLALTRMANYYRTTTYKAVKNGTAVPSMTTHGL